jgi:uncharacterized oxidoreductase
MMGEWIMQITGITILITGGDAGIGRALAEAFHAEGNQVIIACRCKQQLESTVVANPAMKAAELDIMDPYSIWSFTNRRSASILPSMSLSKMPK